MCERTQEERSAGQATKVFEVLDGVAQVIEEIHRQNNVVALSSSEAWIVGAHGLMLEADAGKAVLFEGLDEPCLLDLFGPDLDAEHTPHAEVREGEAVPACGAGNVEEQPLGADAVNQLTELITGVA